MIYLFSFEGLREIEESRYRLPQKLIVQSFEEGFLLRGRMEYLFEQPEDYEIFSGDIDRIVLEEFTSDEAIDGVFAEIGLRLDFDDPFERVTEV